MVTEFFQQLIVGLTGAQTEISREILEISKQNLRINTMTLEQTIKRNELEKDLAESIRALINLLKEK